MKKIRMIALVTLVLSLFWATTALANDWSWELVEGHHNQSVLLGPSETTSKDMIHKHGRGDYLSEGSVEISNLQNGQLMIEVLTLAHVNVDRIIHSVFLDIWDEDREDWINIDMWDFEISKEDVENEELYLLSTDFVLSGYEVGRYYRLRGLHGVELYDELEACATETDGVQLTDWRDW